VINIEEVINKLKDIFNAKTDVELSRKLGFSDRVVTTWKQRNTLNFEKIIEIAVKKDIDLNYLFKPSKKGNNVEFDLLEEFVFFSLKRTLFSPSFVKKILKIEPNPIKEFLIKVTKESIKGLDYSRNNAKLVLVNLVKNYKIKSILDSQTKKENTIKFIEENMSNLDCYVFLKYFDKFELI